MSGLRPISTLPPTTSFIASSNYNQIVSEYHEKMQSVVHAYLFITTELPNRSFRVEEASMLLKLLNHSYSCLNTICTVQDAVAPSICGDNRYCSQVDELSRRLDALNLDPPLIVSSDLSFQSDQNRCIDDLLQTYQMWLTPKTFVEHQARIHRLQTTLLRNLKNISKVINLVRRPLEVAKNNALSLPPATQLSFPLKTAEFIQTLLKHPEIKGRHANLRGHWGKISRVFLERNQYAMKQAISNESSQNQQRPQALDDEARQQLEYETLFYLQTKIQKIPYILSLQAVLNSGIFLPFFVQDLCKCIKTLTRSQLLSWMLCIAKALKGLHDAGFTYRDLKASNILIKNDREAYLCDFGLVILTTQDKGPGGTAYASPPETLQSGIELSVKVDTWAFGTLLYAVLTCNMVCFRNPLSEESLSTYLHSIYSDLLKGQAFTHNKLFSTCSIDRLNCLDPYGAIQNIVLQCLKLNPSSRPSMQELMTSLEELQTAPELPLINLIPSP